MGYGEAPWVFKGRALYQLQLVKTEEARKYVPDNFKIVDFFGYTLGGFYLARYDDSPVGAFDELVALAGIVWNPPTSCAWAARVFVNNREARDHGLRHFGLPSRVAAFNEVSAEASQGQKQQQQQQQQHSKKRDWWRLAAPTRQPNTIAGSSVPGDGPLVLELHNKDPVRGRSLRSPVCRIAFPAATAGAGPDIKMALPSFSGGTPEVPQLVQYACALSAKIRLLPAARVMTPPPEAAEASSSERLEVVLTGKPLIAFEFFDMEMRVEEPLLLKVAAAPATATKPQWAAASITSASSSALWARAA